jgi:hypothetical protein
LIPFLGISQNSYLNKTSNNYIQNDHSTIRLDTLLILGVGSIGSRIFLDKLSGNLMKSFKEKNIVAQYLYLGKNITEAKEVFKNILIDNQTAILFLLPSDTSFYSSETSTIVTIPNNQYSTLDLTSSSTSIPFLQKFFFKLYSNEEKMKLVWTASVEVNCNLSSSKVSQKISKNIIANFISNRYF